ncbi:hypothetical protein ACFYW6_33975 [Streptomyces sp. NPDC002659]|uniref:hypothetical protein n=1 Tax=Streptomyces sp. NPDC002659 TaxID=3364656 RepID=UPI003692B296
MTEPLPDRTDEMVAWLRERIATDPASAAAAPELRDAALKILDLYRSAAAQARRDDSFLQGWAPQADAPHHQHSAAPPTDRDPAHMMRAPC